MMRVGLDGELAARVEAAGGEIDRAHDGSLVVGDDHLGVEFQTLQRVHLGADVVHDPQPADALDQLVLLERVRRPRQDVDLHAAPRGAHQPLDDDRVLVALVLQPERVLRRFDEVRRCARGRCSGTR